MDQGMFQSRKEAESTTLGELLERHLCERTIKKKGAEPEACRIRALIRHPLANRAQHLVTFQIAKIVIIGIIRFDGEN